MSNKSLSRIDMRSAILALSVVTMLIAVSFGVNNAEAASPVTFAADKTSVDVMKEDLVAVTITVTNTESGNSAFRNMDVHLNAVWVAGGGWSTEWVDNEDDQNLIDDDTIRIGSEESETVVLLIYCDGG